MVALLFTALALSAARHLRIDTDLANLIPSDYPSVQALERLRDTVGGESDVAVVIESASFESQKAVAEALIPRAMALRGPQGDSLFTRYEYRKDVSFLQNNALYFATNAELDQLEAYLQEEIEAAKLEANPFYFDLDDDDAGDAQQAMADQLRDVYARLVAKEYPVSDDSTTMVVRFYPAQSQTNIGYIEEVYARLDSLVAAMEPTSFGADVKVTLAGRLLRQLTEIRAVTDDVFGSFGAGVALVLLIVVSYFSYKAYHARAGRRFSARILATEIARAPAMALLIGLPLFMSLSWTFGLAYLAFDTLNLMTSTLGLVLFGLGIDYGIHFYARYAEERGRGHDVGQAAEVTFVSTGQAIAVGALTTAGALYVLTLADFKGFSEFGFIAGTGILLALVSMLVVLPALIVLGERARLLNLTSLAPSGNGVATPARRIPAARGLVLASLALVVASLILLPRARFEYEFGKLEPRYEAYSAKLALVRRVYDSGRRNPAYVVVDDPAEVPAVVAALREKQAAEQARAASDSTFQPMIGTVESLQERFPLEPAAQQAKLARIAFIRDSLLADPFVQAEMEDDADLRRLAAAAQTRAPIDVAQVPDYLKQQFASKQGDIGGFVMVYPPDSISLSDGRYSIAFSNAVGTFRTAGGAEYHAGSTSLVAADMLRLMMREAPWMVLATFIIVVALMVLNFRSFKWAGLALLPLVVGVLWMLFLMEVLDLKLNFYNLVVLPAVLGIGNDAGVHLVHRYREQGRGALRALLRSPGEHVAMASLTTMVGFGGLLLSFHPGLRSIGELAVVGIGATLVAALVFLPALLQWIEDRQAVHPAQPAPAGPALREA